ncbi:WD40 repeat domain-containing protein [Planobispora siamensis]|uniref:WD domain-containing protein, G-beta repeat-containing protein n=1 Tax=Planobispora siamensis TaxID=936338 RepID=A0A8J3SRT5_9ACTN|nr:hypothetical protein [Planobispora siamensis]GIH97707.1 hypothetical protein Psi01_83370 [Planobispora siamensis]
MTDGTALAFHPAGQMLAVGYNDGTVRLWKVFTGEHAGVFSTGHGLGLNALAFHPGGQLLVSAGNDGTARLWRRQPARPAGRQVATCYTGRAQAGAPTPDRAAG